MNYKKKNYLLLIASIILVVVGFSLALPEMFGFCKRTDAICIDEYIYRYNTLSVLLIVFSAATLFISVISLFLLEQVFNAWLKFATIFMLVSVVIIAISPSVGDMFFPSIKEVAIFSLPVIYLIVSLGLIILQAKKLKK